MDVHHHCRDHHHSNMNDVVKFKPKKKMFVVIFKKNQSSIDRSKIVASHLNILAISPQNKINDDDNIGHSGGGGGGISHE